MKPLSRTFFPGVARLLAHDTPRLRREVPKKERSSGPSLRCGPKKKKEGVHAARARHCRSRVSQGDRRLRNTQKETEKWHKQLDM